MGLFLCYLISTIVPAMNIVSFLQYISLVLIGCLLSFQRVVEDIKRKSDDVALAVKQSRDLQNVLNVSKKNTSNQSDH